MAGIADEAQSRIWRIVKFNGTLKLSEQFIPFGEATEEQIVALLEGRVKDELTEREIHNTPQLFRVRREPGARLTLSAGKNPRYVASLWRIDELGERD